MGRIQIGGCAVLLVLTALPARATFVKIQMPIPEMVGGADMIIVGKVNRIQQQLIRAYPEPKAAKQEYYQIVEVTIKDRILGAKGLTRIKMGVQCFITNLPNARPKVSPSIPWMEGQEACLFLKRHHSGKFYEAGFDNMIREKDPLGANANYKQDIELTKKCARLLSAPDKGLKSENAEDRRLTAVMLIRKYRGPMPGPFDFGNPAKNRSKQEPISAEQSKLILKTLAEADWSLAKEPFPSASHPSNLFRRLGLTEKDGWKFKQKPVRPLDGRAAYQAHLELVAAAKKWLKSHAATYRIKRYVHENSDHVSSTKEKPPRDQARRDGRDRKDKPKKEGSGGSRSKGERDALRAAAKLKLIKALLEGGKTEAAKNRLEQLIKTYPKTPAAQEAKKLLKDLD